VLYLIKLLDIKGCNVIDEYGVVKGSVEDFIFDAKGKRIYSSIVLRKTPLSHLYILKFCDIKHLGDNLMTKGGLFPIDKSIISKNCSKMLNSFIDRAIIDSNGNEVGEMKDAIIEENTGIVKAIICSRGFVEDIMEGRRVVLVDDDTIFGQDKIIIKDSNINIYNDMSIWKLTKG
jgi:uncharacterized protein YrrD